MNEIPESLQCYRRPTRSVRLGGVQIGGGAPVAVQSMTNTDTRDVAATLTQVDALVRAGCEVVRVAVPDESAASALDRIVAGSAVPIVADIHFRGCLAMMAMERGVAGIRINPGTLPDAAELRAVAEMAAGRGVVVRIGINSGSLAADVRSAATDAESLGVCMAESAVCWCRRFESWGCSRLKVSLKSSSILETVAAYRAFAERSDVPVHIGLTEAGGVRYGRIKSAVALGCLLLEGIGDTIRVSLTGDPVPEVAAAYEILQAAGLRHRRPDVISCPTCGRTEIGLAPIVEAVEVEIDRLLESGHRISLDRIAVMGCVVNGPGEARDADVGIAGGRGCGVLFRRGEVVRRLAEGDLAAALIQEIRDAASPE